MTSYALAHRETGELLNVECRSVGLDGETEWMFSTSRYEMVWNNRNYYDVSGLTKDTAWGDMDRPTVPDDIDITDYKIVALTYK